MTELIGVVYVINIHNFNLGLTSEMVMPMYYENFDLENIVTPVKVNELRKLLEETEYDKEKSKKLLKGFTEGFSIGYHGPKNVQQTSLNLKLDGETEKVILWNKLMKEVKLKRVAGPFKTVPFKNFIQSPIGLVQKDNGKDVRMIFHLSYPKMGTTSMNANTPKGLCSVAYPDFNKAIDLCIRAGKGCKISKSDMKSAFRNLGLNRSSWNWMVMKVVSPLDGITYYFVDKCLPFGASISCALFQSFSDAVSHIVKKKSKADNVNYLGDFLFVAMLHAFCNAQLNMFLTICDRINFPVSLEKTFYASSRMTFLGFLIDTIAQLVLIPSDKVTKARDLISKVLDKHSKKITLRELQQICGFLNFLGRCIVPGCAFTRHLYSYTANPKLKPHHHIRVNREMREDLLMWLSFINHPSVYVRGFIDFTHSIQADLVRMTSDASRVNDLGFGGICNTSWMFGAWPEGYIEHYQPSIEYLELFALVATVLNWIHRYQNRRVIIQCDNQSVVAMVNKTTSSCKNCMVLIRKFVLICLKENVKVFAQYIPSKLNIESDLLSSLKIDKFLSLQTWDQQQTPVPHELWPIEKLWVD